MIMPISTDIFTMPSLCFGAAKTMLSQWKYLPQTAVWNWTLLNR